MAELHGRKTNNINTEYATAQVNTTRDNSARRVTTKFLRRQYNTFGEYMQQVKLKPSYVKEDKINTPNKTFNHEQQCPRRTRV